MSTPSRIDQGLPPVQPLSHHQMLALATPFVRAGHRVDLGASNRARRQLAFQAAQPQSAGAAAGGWLRQRLQLACQDDGSLTLTRVLDHASGLTATLSASGSSAAALLQHIDAVAPQRHFDTGPGWSMARSYTVAEPAAGGPASATPPAPPLLLTEAAIALSGLSLALQMLPLRGVPADIVLTPDAGGPLALPDDALAVLGWDWARLVAVTPIGWKTRLRLRGANPRRSATAERALLTLAPHLAQLLAEPPRCFHDRHAGARWGVVFRRLIPSLTALALIGAALLLPHIGSGTHSGLYMALHYVPIAVLALSFKLQELPRFEIPPWPRRSTLRDWLCPGP